jgi:glucose/arabinose dehydrogenase
MVVNADLGHMLFGIGIDPPEPEVLESRLRVPEGLGVALWAEGLRGARMLRFTPAGDLLVSLPRSGEIHLLLADRDGDLRSDGDRILAEGLDRPHGLDFHEGRLFVAEGSAIVRFDFAEEGPGTARVVGEPVRIVEGIPAGGNHWSRTLRFGPDGGLYLTIGSSCNVCEEDDPRRAAMMRFEPDGSGGEIFATGLRNSVGFDWRPGTNALFATDNGRDLLGDDFPPCELNRIERGGFYGWPHANGWNEPDPDLGRGHEGAIARAVPPVHGFGAHTAPLGVTFVRGADPAADLAGAALVALHGSWNRTKKAGYRVVSLHWNEQGEIEERDFLTGFEQAEDVIGRPVDVAEGPDGAFYVSDDYAGVIYRIGPKDGDGSALEGRRFERDRGARPESTSTASLAALDPEKAAALASQGEVLFAAYECGRCHLEAQASEGVVVRPLEQLSSRHDLASLESLLLVPPPPMPVYDLPEGERRALAVHLLRAYGD